MLAVATVATLFCIGVRGAENDKGKTNSSSSPVTTVTLSTPGWPCWRGPTMNRCAGDKLPLVDGWDEKGPKYAWAKEFPGRPGKGDGKFCGVGSPVVGDGKVYLVATIVTDANVARLKAAGKLDAKGGIPNPTAGDPNRTLMVNCWDAITGADIWQTGLPTGDSGFTTSATPCLDAGRLYVQTHPGGLIGLDANTGKLLWSDGNMTVPTSGYGCHWSPIAYKGIVFGSGHAWDGATGKVLWTTKGSRGLMEDGKSGSMATVVLFKGVPALLTDCGVLELATGKALAPWKFPRRHCFSGGFFVWFGGDQRSEATEGASGQCMNVSLVTDTGIRSCGGTPVPRTGYYEICDGPRAFAHTLIKAMNKSTKPGEIKRNNDAFAIFPHNGLICIETHTGKVLWSNHQIEFATDAGELLADGKIIGFGASPGTLCMFDAKTGALLGKPVPPPSDTPLYGFSCGSSPAFANGRVYYRSQGGSGGKSSNAKCGWSGMGLVCVDLRKP